VLMVGVFVRRSARLGSGCSAAAFVRLTLYDERNGAEQLGYRNGSPDNKASGHR